jgi:hypothetical protein
LPSIDHTVTAPVPRYTDTGIIPAVEDAPDPWSWTPERLALRAAMAAGLVAWLAFCARVIWLCWG